MRIAPILLFLLLGTATPQDRTGTEELNIRISPSITSDQIARLSELTVPDIYTTRHGDSLAMLSGRRYGIKVRMRDAIRALNPDLAQEMARQGKDFFWQSLPAGTVVRLPPFSRIIRDVSVSAGDERDALIEAKPFYWSVGPKTRSAIRAKNALLFDSASSTNVTRADLNKERQLDHVTLPAPPTFHSLTLRSGMLTQAQNLLQSLTDRGLASGQIGTPAFLERISSPCEVAQEATDDWFIGNSHASEIAIDKLQLSPTIIAILDSGVDPGHPALTDHFWDGSIDEDEDLDLRLDQTIGINFTSYPFSNDVRDLSPNSHGTHVSGIASGEAISRDLHTFQLAHLGAAIKVMPLKVVDDQEHVSVQAIEDALQFAQRHQAKIISASWNVNKDVNLEAEMLNEQGTLFVLAAGNGVKEPDGYHGLDLENNDIYPPSYKLDNAITVGALAADGTPADFSNFGNKTVQIFAPGCAIISTISGNAYGRETGTSQAAPFVSLTAALIWAQNPALSPLAVKRRILQTADPAKGSISKSVDGSLNTAKAVSIKQDLVETTDGVYHYGEVQDDKLVITAPGDLCAETDSLAIRRQKVTRIYHNYGMTGHDIAIQQNGARTEGTICATEIHFKNNSGIVEDIQLQQLRDIIFRM